MNRTICSITSGLGNQLFQYAAGLHWVQNHGGKLILDASWFGWQRHSPKRKFLLRHFSIPEQPAAPGMSSLLFVARIAQRYFSSSTEKFLHLALGLRKIKETNVHEPDARFTSGKALAHKVWLDGYWQTANHFQAVEKALRKRLTPAFLPSEGFSAWQEKIRSHGGVSVHVRRGDYATLGHGMLTPEYYSAAAHRFPDQRHWFVFSEEPDWCRANLKLPGVCFFVDFSSPRREIEELLLMAACRGNIIANSSYSWWGAALGNPLNRTVVAPRYRHGQKQGDVQKHRLPQSWALIDQF